MKITFADSASNFVLEVFGYAVNNEGFICNKENPDLLITDDLDLPIHISDFGGMTLGNNGVYVVIRKNRLNVL